MENQAVFECYRHNMPTQFVVVDMAKTVSRIESSIGTATFQSVNLTISSADKEKISMGPFHSISIREDVPGWVHRKSEELSGQFVEIFS